MGIYKDRSSLFPGHQNVEAFSPELEEDYEEEVSYVTLDLGSIDPAIVTNASQYALIGLDTPTPFLQVGSLFYKGSYEDIIGSELLFSEGSSGERRKPKLTYHDVGERRRIVFQEVTLKSKQGSTSAPPVTLPVVSVPAAGPSNASAGPSMSASLNDPPELTFVHENPRADTLALLGAAVPEPDGAAGGRGRGRPRGRPRGSRARGGLGRASGPPSTTP